MDKNANTKKIRNEKDVVMEESSRSRLNNSRKRRLDSKRNRAEINQAQTVQWK